MVFGTSYFDESYYKMPVHDSEVVLCNRMISTYINALAKAGFVIEQMIEQNVSDMNDTSDKAKKAEMIPISMCFKARKLSKTTSISSQLSAAFSYTYKKAETFCFGFKYIGIYLSFRVVTNQVFSTQMSLTSVFGMGTGGTSSP